MKELKEYLAKLDKMIFHTAESKELIGDLWKVSLSTKFLTGTREKFRVQVIIHVRYADQHASTWGSESNESNDAIVLWFLQRKNLIQHNQYDGEEQLRNEAKEVFNMM